jgi:type I restriction-modification system DNA methylase subunit
MNAQTLGWITNFIWGIADDVLRDVYVRGKYRDVILPMVVIRRLDAVLEPTKQAVLDMKKNLDAAGVANQEAALRQAAGQAFYNASPFTLRDLKSRVTAQRLKDDFEAYLDGFSSNVQEILDKFKFRNQIPTLVEADILGSLIEKFLDRSINLSPQPVLDTDGKEKVPALDNHAMGTMFEELSADSTRKTTRKLASISPLEMLSSSWRNSSSDPFQTRLNRARTWSMTPLAERGECSPLPKSASRNWLKSTAKRCPSTSMVRR